MLALLGSEPLDGEASSTVKDAVDTYGDASSISSTVKDAVDTYGKADTDSKSLVLKRLMKVRGVGPKVASDLYDMGIRTIEQLAEAKGVSRSIVIAAKYHKQVTHPMTTAQVEHNWSILKPELKKVSRPELAGSYRRGTRTHGDMDIAVFAKDLTGDDLLEHLRISVEGQYVDYISVGDSKMTLIFAFESEQYTVVELYLAPPDEYGAMMLYLTGPYEFSIVTRIRAKKMGFFLNQHGLFDGKTGKIIVAKTEKSIFKQLELPYINPRLRGSKAVYDKHFAS